jgi:hypothetical protein
MNSSLETILATYPAFLSSMRQLIDAEAMEVTLRAVADTPAPSQIGSVTRGSVLQRLAGSHGIFDRGATYLSDAYDSGGDVLTLGDDGLRMVAHLDEISYLLAGEPVHGRWPLRAYCYHLAEGPRAGAVIRYDDGEYRIVSRGEVLTDETNRIWYRPDEGALLRFGDRVFLPSPLEVDKNTGRVTGSLDNAVGVAAVLLAARLLAHLDIPFSAVFPDEEEGPAGQSSQTISRGAARLLPPLPTAPLTVVTDIHGLADDQLDRTEHHQRPWGASLAESSSGTRGSVTPPPLYHQLRELFTGLEGEGIPVQPNVGGYIPRSDDVVAMLHSRNVCILGFPGYNRHFDRGKPTGNLHDFVALARALALLGAATATGLMKAGR